MIRLAFVSDMNRPDDLLSDLAILSGTNCPSIGILFAEFMIAQTGYYESDQEERFVAALFSGK